MHILLDNLTATMIATAVILMVIAANLRGRTAMTDATAFYAMIHQQEEFGQILARDLNSVSSLQATALRTSDSTFTFRGFIGNSSTERTITYKYRLTRVQHGMRYHRVERYVDGQLDGGSGDIITGLKIEARDAFGAPVANTDAAKQIFVRFAVASLTARDQANPVAQARRAQRRVETSYWESSFSPVLLQ